MNDCLFFNWNFSFYKLIDDETNSIIIQQTIHGSILNALYQTK